MFCPTCGKENFHDKKFCVSCGTNLEAVTQALSGDKTDFFTKVDTALDQFIARYAEHVFQKAPQTASDRKVSNSWKVLGQGMLTSFVDLFLAFLMFNLFSVRFQILLISTPFRLLSERMRRQKKATADLTEQTPVKLPAPEPPQWLPGVVDSVTDHTTERLQEYQRTKQNRPSKTD
jgi:hypothetical protein